MLRRFRRLALATLSLGLVMTLACGDDTGPDPGSGGEGGTGGAGTGGAGGVVIDCEPPLVDCDGMCVDLTSDVDNCGMCGQPCVEVANATVTCSFIDGGSCAYQCDPGFTPLPGNPPECVPR